MMLYNRAGTSYEAAESIGPHRPTLRARVRDFIALRGSEGATDAEIAAALDLAENTARPRRYELEHSEEIVDSGQRRLTPSGRKAIVWIIPEGQGKLL